MTTLAPDRQETKSAPRKARAPDRATGRGQADTLAIAWTHGQLHAATYRRSNLVATWESSDKATTLEQFGSALDVGLKTLNYRGTDVVLLLAHDQFTHQTEACPSFSEGATKAYLRGRIERHEEEYGPVLSVAQPVAPIRKEAQHLLHLLPHSFYHELNNLLLARHLEISRIIPTNVPLELEISDQVDDSRPAILLAARIGDSTALIACRQNGEILLSRTTLGTWSDDPSRVAVEINRSLLYAKQQHGAAIDHIILTGKEAEEARPEIESKCGEGKSFAVRDTDPINRLSATVRLPLRHPVNLVAGYLRKKRSNHFLRRVILISCWFLFALLALDTWIDEQDWSAEQTRMSTLGANEDSLHETYDRMLVRNAGAARNRSFVKQVVDDRLPPVPDRFLAYVASIVPREVQLSHFLVTWNNESKDWTFRIEGTLEADPETARMTIRSIRRQLSKSPLQVRFIESVRPEVELSLATEATLQRFTLEGGLFEF
ncbi:MAG: hypothetical protein DRP71_03265 [Verrucomicrobia bacterium]|nr:MAG: hypothetical protein DRP71_03265 [Verrucomicrobiota bacterium]